MPTVLITGAARGIGLEFVRQYAAAGWSVIGTCRDPADAEKLQALGDVRAELLDMRDRPALAAFGDRLAGAPLDLFIANAGITAPDRMTSAEDADRFLEVLAVNSVAPTLLAVSLRPNVVQAQGKMVAVTSEMGSIARNASGGWLAYRASKSALNSAWRTLAIEMAADPIAIAMLHPGWVKTDMGGRGAPLEPPESVRAMRQVINRLSANDKGVYLNYRGETLPW